MKYYSEKLNKLYDTENELHEAELNDAVEKATKAQLEKEILDNITVGMSKFSAYIDKYGVNDAGELFLNICEIIDKEILKDEDDDCDCECCSDDDCDCECCSDEDYE